MNSRQRFAAAVRTGLWTKPRRHGVGEFDIDFMDSERVIRISENWDMDVISPWRRLMPNTLFAGFNGKATSRLYVTTDRIVLLRRIDSWREVKGDMTPLGMPTAIAKGVELGRLSRAGVRQFCELSPKLLRLVSASRLKKGNSWLSMRLLGDDDRKYAVMIWKTDGRDEDMLNLIESQFSLITQSLE